MTKTPRDDRDGVNQTWKALTNSGYTIVVIDGEGQEFHNLKRKEAIQEVMSCDEGYFVAVNEFGRREGWVWFVFGNDPDEVVCDYTTSLSHVIDPLTESWWR